MTSSNASDSAPLVVVVDGDCALCVGLVEWMGRRLGGDVSPRTVVFVPGQSDLGGEVLRWASVTDFDSVLVVADGQALSESNAVLALATILPRGYRALAAIARVVPRSWRDTVYRGVAKRRFRIWGRVEVCAIDARVAGVTYGPRGLLARDEARGLLVLAGAIANE